jgi:hypothetical protein
MGRTFVKITDALRDVQRLCIETAPLIYYVEEHPEYIAKMDAIIQAVDDQSIEAFSSIITLTEVLNRPMKTGSKKLEQEYRDILVNSACMVSSFSTGSEVIVACHLTGWLGSSTVAGVCH